MKKLVFLFLPFLFLISCKDKNQIPKDVLPEEKMQEVMWSMIYAGEFLNAYVLNKDSVDKVAESSKIYGQVFQVHHITKEEFDKSYSYYRQHPDLMKALLDSLSKKQTYTAEKFKKTDDTLLQKRLPRDTVK
jgi:hypothetical protein